MHLIIVCNFFIEFARDSVKRYQGILIERLNDFVFLNNLSHCGVLFGVQPVHVLFRMCALRFTKCAGCHWRRNVIIWCISYVIYATNNVLHESRVVGKVCVIFLKKKNLLQMYRLIFNQIFEQITLYYL